MLKRGLGRLVSARLRNAALVMGALLALWTAPAHAVIITVGGTDYDVVFYSNGIDVPQPSFDDNAADLTNTVIAPWWGDGAAALAFANAYAVQAPPGSFDINSGFDIIMFAHAEAGGIVSVVRIVDTGTRTVSTTTLTASIGYGDAVYAYTVPIAAVPEIDGNALAKALFVLFTLYVWLQVRRNRRRVA